MSGPFTRCPENPVVVPGKYAWRMATVFNPGALYEEGRFYLYERDLSDGQCRGRRHDLPLLWGVRHGDRVGDSPAGRSGRAGHAGPRNVAQTCG